MALNVNRAIQDQFYRYKMPRLAAKVEGKGNGVKTVITNMVDIARALARPPTYPTKYFGCELGAQTQFDFKNDRYIVNGSHDASKLQDMLDGFIKKFVLCEQCQNPETVFKISVKKGLIGARCKACGYVFQLDMTHKLTTFILKNPPEQEMNTQGTSLTKKKDKKSSRKDEEGENNNDAENANGDAGSDDWGDDGDGDDGDWCDDVSQEAVTRRMKELTSGVKGLAMDSDLEKTEGERIDIFHHFVKEKIATTKDEPKGLNSVDKEIHQEAERLEVTNKAPIILCELLFDGSMAQQIKKNKRVLLRFTNENQKAQKYLLGGFEKTVEAHKGVLLNKVPVILKAFYDEDVVDEEVILDWAKKVSKKYVGKDLSEQIHKKAEPFIKWLKEAEEETSDEESDIDLEFDERAKISTIKVKEDEEEVAPAAAAGNGTVNGGSNGKKENEGEEEEEEDDIDIDDI